VIAWPPVELMTDEYQLAMADSYLAQGKADGRVAFELFVRALPQDRGFLVAAGLERVCDYLTSFRFGTEAIDYLRRSHTVSDPLLRYLASLRFDGDVDAVPEGTVVHAGEPLLRVEGGRLACQLAETFLLNQVNFQTMIATKAARIVAAAGGRPVVDFGFRRAHGADAGLLAARAAYIGGCSATATVAAGFLWGIPTSGTMAHSYVLSFPSDVEAFCAFMRDHPDRSTLLIDTRDAISGARAACRASQLTGIVPQAVRLDSGDLVETTGAVRAILDGGGWTSTGSRSCSPRGRPSTGSGWARR
jgi:nicotinate phosphoribosyltransferase